MNQSAINKAAKVIADAGLELVQVNEASGHYQIKGGALLVNWYPLSKKQTAYVRATQKGIQNADVQKVIQLANSAPEISPEKVKRNGNRGQRAKRRMLKAKPFCHWCGMKLTAETATLEHIIPLKRGGLDHHNNMALACKSCNEKRGHNMPELEGTS